MNMKIDTQGMSLDTGKNTGKSLEEQRASIPDVKPKQINIISDSLKKELKDCLLYTSPSPRDDVISRMPSSA